MFVTALQPRYGLTLEPNFVWLVFVLLAGYLTVEALSHRAHRSDDQPFTWIPVEGRFAVYAVITYIVFLRVIEARGFVYLQF
jgi:hypothetical protein